MSVKVRGLTFSYKDFSLGLDQLDFESAQITSIVGPNGAGKTTLIKCIGSILPVKRESLFIDGKDVALMKGRERARLISYVPQEHGSAFNYTVLDFVLMGRAAYLPLFSLPSEKDVEIAEEALAFAGLKSFSSRPYFQLSSGERRLVLIARALAQRAEILLLDEPTTFLDPRHETDILDLTRKLAGEMKKTVIITLHNLDMALKYSDFMVFMKKGGIVSSGRPRDILSESLLEDVYGIKMKIVEYNGRKFIVK